MNDFIVFSVGTNAYAVEVTHVDRIVQIPTVTPVVNAHPFIDGMMVYETKTTKILNLRKAVGVLSREEELGRTFERLQHAHEEWMEALRSAVEEGTAFPYPTDPHASELGKWLERYASHDPKVIALLRGVSTLHARLHDAAAEILAHRAQDAGGPSERFRNEAVPLYWQLSEALERMNAERETIAKEQQKLVIYRDGEGVMAVKVDGIDDIVPIDETAIRPYDHDRVSGGCVGMRGIVELGGKLVIVIDSLRLPGSGEV